MAKTATEQQETKPDPAPARPEQKRKPVPAIHDGRFAAAEYERSTWVITAEEGTIPEDVLNADYYAHVAAKLSPYDRIEVRANDGTWVAELLVLDVSRLWAKVHALHLHKLTTVDVSQSNVERSLPYFVRYQGPHDKWVVVRRADSQAVSTGHGTPEAANEWMINRIKAG